jgi:hypothetical protein
VPLIDVNWLVFAPFDPARDFRIDPPNVPKSITEVRKITSTLRDLTGGKFILTPHSGTYCRTGYYEDEILDTYREAVAGGAELAVHLHEEIKGAGTRFAEYDHVLAMFRDCQSRLRAAGIEPVAYRGGHYAYHPFMNRILADNGIFIDYSCCPGLNEPTREAIWVNAERSSYYLPENPRLPAAGQIQSPILEIPIGSDGAGSVYRNLLHVEQSELHNLQRIWSVILARAEKEQRPQIVHCLFHTGSVGEEKWLDRYRRFLEYVPKHGGVFVTTLEAKAVVDALAREQAA